MICKRTYVLNNILYLIFIYVENDAIFTVTKIGYDAVKNYFPSQLVFPVNEITFTLTAGSHWFPGYPWLVLFQIYVILFANLQLLSRPFILSSGVAATDNVMPRR